MPWESPERAALDLHASAILNEERRAQKIVQDGSKVLKTLGLGRYIKGQWVPRPKDMDVLNEFFDALHHPSEVAAGTRRIPAGMDDVYRTLRAKTDWEEAARLDFDPEMALIEDYFYRGWKPPEGAFIDQQGSLISNPAFRKPRKDATYQEMRDLGFEPLSWNPFEQWRISRMQGVKFRQQTDLVDFLKGMGEDLIRPHQGGPIIEGWRVPEVGKAFQGKPFAYLDEFGQQQQGHGGAWIVPDDVANMLENTYGKAPTLRKIKPFGRSIDLMKVIDWLVFVPKRVKLVGSFFQPIDFLIRAGIGSWGASVNAIRTGHPVAAVQSVIGYPGTARDLIGAFFSPNWRKNLTQRLEDTTPIVRGRPGINVKGISESGLNIMDPTIFARDPLGLDAAIREVVQETLKAKIYKTVPRALLELERVMRQGLFGGVYPAAIINDIQKNIAPQMIRTYGKTLNDAQLNRAIAQAANLRYSSLPATQSVVQNTAVRNILMRVSFSMNENEGLLRQATNTLPVGFQFSRRGLPKIGRGGHFSKFWADHWLGAYAFLISTASVIHYASTGEHLPADRFSPISADKWGPLPFGYNTKFAAPTLSTDFARQLLGEAGDVLEGRPSLAKAGLEARADIVGQMDTALKVLDPWAWIGSRQSVPVSAFSELEEGEDFYGTPTDEVGPGGIVSMTTHLLQTMFAPIGWAGAGINIAVQNYEILEPFLSMGEEKLGAAGQIVQALGLNLRAEGIDEAIERMHPDFETYRQSEKNRIRGDLIEAVYGLPTRRDKERWKEKFWEFNPPTDVERARFKERLDREERQREIRMRDQGPGGDDQSPGFLRDVISDIITNFPNPVGR
ncbi:MAG: hypothetical protein U9R70_01845 [Pseudomonadota bacterium]|nr:hypothetical protein [Pseudomonadota bacterium]